MGQQGLAQDQGAGYGGVGQGNLAGTGAQPAQGEQVHNAVRHM